MSPRALRNACSFEPCSSDREPQVLDVYATLWIVQQNPATFGIPVEHEPIPFPDRPEAKLQQGLLDVNAKNLPRQGHGSE